MNEVKENLVVLDENHKKYYDLLADDETAKKIICLSQNRKNDYVKNLDEKKKLGHKSHGILTIALLGTICVLIMFSSEGIVNSFIRFSVIQLITVISMFIYFSVYTLFRDIDKEISKINKIDSLILSNDEIDLINDILKSKKESYPIYLRIFHIIESNESKDLYIQIKDEYVNFVSLDKNFNKDYFEIYKAFHISKINALKFSLNSYSTSAVMVEYGIVIDSGCDLLSSDISLNLDKIKRVCMVSLYSPLHDDYQFIIQKSLDTKGGECKYEKRY